MDWSPDEYVYMQLADHLAGQIEGGDLPPGSRLPSETDLMEQYGVAKMTVRRAVAELRGRGLVRTLHGRGTFVRKG